MLDFHNFHLSQRSRDSSRDVMLATIFLALHDLIVEWLAAAVLKIWEEPVDGFEALNLEQFPAAVLRSQEFYRRVVNKVQRSLNNFTQNVAQRNNFLECR